MPFLCRPGLEALKPETVSNEENVKSLKRLETSLKRSLLGASKESRDYSATVNRLSRSLEGFKRVLDDPGKSNGAFDRFEKSVLSNLPVLFQEIKTSLQASAVKESDLPPELRARYVTPDGRYRVEVLPRENILKPDALKRFVEVVTALAPNSTDAPVTIREAGNAVVHSFLQATLYALLAISLYLLIELKSVSDTALILLPLAFSLLMTGAGSVVFDIPFNFANVIVIPLLLGSGVEGIYLVYRFRSDPAPERQYAGNKHGAGPFF